MHINSFGDQYGPEMVIEVYEPKVGLKGMLVIDNTTLGPSKGGVRITPSVTVQEVFKLARVMTWKTALAKLPFGGAKAGIVANLKNLTREQKKKLIQEFAKAIKPFSPSKYIAGPDIGTGEEEMDWYTQANGDWHSATGKPAEVCMKFFGKPGEKCGIPHEYGSTGFGVACAAEAAAKHLGLDLKDLTLAIEGFGNVGSFAFKHLDELGASVVAVADSKGTVYNPHGLDFNSIQAIKREAGTVTAYKRGKILSHKDIFTLPVDIIIPASLPEVINDKNAEKVRARIIIEAANLPVSETAEKILAKKGVLIVPDLIANAGGVISSYSEYIGENPKDMFREVEKRITENVRFILEHAKDKNLTPREAALGIVKARIARGFAKNVNSTLAQR